MIQRPRKPINDIKNNVYNEIIISQKIVYFRGNPGNNNPDQTETIKIGFNDLEHQKLNLKKTNIRKFLFPEKFGFSEVSGRKIITIKRKPLNSASATS